MRVFTIVDYGDVRPDDVPRWAVRCDSPGMVWDGGYMTFVLPSQLMEEIPTKVLTDEVNRRWQALADAQAAARRL